MVSDSVLARFLTEHYALRPGYTINPYRVRGQKLVRPRPKPIPNELLNEFLMNELGRLKWMGERFHWLNRTADRSRLRARRAPRSAAPPSRRTPQRLSPEPLHLELMSSPAQPAAGRLGPGTDQSLHAGAARGHRALQRHARPRDLRRLHAPLSSQRDQARSAAAATSGAGPTDKRSRAACTRPPPVTTESRRRQRSQTARVQTPPQSPQTLHQ